DLLFGHAERVLMLSATILDAHTYLRSLGIDQEEVEVISVPSTFHASRRPVVVRPAARLTRHYLERDLPLLAAAIADLAADHANEKGVVHAHSYYIASYYDKNITDRHSDRVITYLVEATLDTA